MDGEKKKRWLAIAALLGVAGVGVMPFERYTGTALVAGAVMVALRALTPPGP